MFILDKLLTGGIRFVLERIASAVEAEAADDSALREELLAAQMRLELGEITDAEYEQIEKSVFEGMREIRARTRGEPKAIEAGKLEVDAIEADVGDEAAPKKRRAKKRR